MSDSTSAGASFIEGLTGGVTGGYGFRQGIQDRKRKAQLAADLMTLRQQEAARQQAGEQREATTFGEQQDLYQRAQRLRQGVAYSLAHPGEPLPAEFETPDLATARVRGHTLGKLAGRDLSDAEALLAGTDPEVAKALTPHTPGHYFIDETGKVTYSAGGAPGRTVEGVKGPTRAVPGSKQRKPVDPAVQAAVASMWDAMLTGERLEQEDPSAGTRPMASALAEGVGHIPGIGGVARGVVGPLTQRALTPRQQQHEESAGLFVHNYVATLPKARVSPQLITQIRDVFYARPGQTDPAVLRQFREKRRAVATRLRAAARGDPVDLTDLPGFDAGAEGAAPQSGAPAAPGAAPTPAAPTYNPKFWRPP